MTSRHDYKIILKVCLAVCAGFAFLPFMTSAADPTITFINPTPSDNSIIPGSGVYINTLAGDAGTLLLDWNKGLLGWWRFNNESGESATTLKDWSSYGNNGTCSGAACPVAIAGKFGKALKFDGIDDCITTKNSNLGDDVSALTVSAWIYPTAGGYALAFASKDDLSANRCWYFGMNDSNSFKAALWTSSGRTDVSAGGLGLNQWTHVAFTYDGSTISLYKNGALVAAKAARGQVAKGSTPVAIGCTNKQYYFKGTLDDVRIYDRALSAEEMNAAYDGNQSGLAVGLDGLSPGNYSFRAFNQDNNGTTAATEIRNAVVLNYNFYKAETHIHTKLNGSYGSDGTSSVADVISAYKKRGFNIVSVTDHNPRNPYTAADLHQTTPCSSYDQAGFFMCVPGEEFTLTNYHATRIGITKAWSGSVSNSLANYQTALTDAAAQGGLAIIAHPSWNQTLISVASLQSLNYSAMEIWNPVINNGFATDKWDYLLTRNMERKLFGVAGDDMHTIATGMGRGWIKVNLPALNQQSYIAALKAGFFYASQGPSMDADPFTLVCDGNASYHMGENASCSNIGLRATITAGDPSTTIEEIEIISNNRTVLDKLDCPGAQTCTVEYSTAVSVNAYYRIEAVDSNGKYIWSNPIWVGPRACVNECDPDGTKKCSGSGVQTCGDVDGDGCPEWSNVTNCTTGQTCSNGTCHTNPTTTSSTTFTTTSSTSTTRMTTTTTSRTPITTTTTLKKQGDANGDGHVDYNDLIILAASYGKQFDESGFDLRADFDSSDTIDYNDLIVLAAYYGL